MSTFIFLNPGALGEKVLVEDAILGSFAQSVHADASLEYARGTLLEFMRIEKFSAILDLGTTERDIWLPGGAGSPYPDIDLVFPQAAETLLVSSDSANDDATPTTNTGAQSIMLEGLDGTFNPITELVPMEGLGSAPSVLEFLRVNRSYVVDTGTYRGTNEGNITITNSISGNVISYIGAGFGQTQDSHYTIQAGYTGWVRKAMPQVVVGTNKEASIMFWQHPNAGDFTQPYSGAKRLIFQWLNIQSAPPNPFSAQGPFYEKTDLWASAKATGAGSKVDFAYVMTCVKNPPS